MVKSKLLSLGDMESIAKEAMYNALTKYMPPPDEQKEELVLGKILTDDEGVFEIYIPSDRPREAVVISRVTVSRITGEIKVEVFLTPNPDMKGGEP